MRTSRLTPEALRFARRYRRTRVKVTFAVERADKPNMFRSYPGDWAYTWLVR